MNKKTTKRALFLSALSMLLCVSMLVGSTFAWFTDTASTGVNTITAGNLDIDIVDANGDSLEDKSLGFVKEDGSAITGPILWEPGCRYLLQPAKLVNNGNLWVKYTVSIGGYSAPADGADLAKVIDVYEGEKHIGTLSEVLTGGILVAESTLAPKGETGDSAIFGKLKLVMQETAGNEYMNKSISGVSINVFATQLNKEEDSFGPDYDKNAPDLEDEDGNILIGDVVSLMSFARKVNAGDNYAGKTILLTNDIDLAGYSWTPVGSGAAHFSGTFDGDGHTISNMTVYSNEDAGLFGELRGKVMDLTVVNAKVSGNHWAGVIAGHSTDNVGAEITGCTVKNATVTLAPELINGEYDNGDKAGAIMGYIAQGNPGITNCTVETATIVAYRDLGGVVGCSGSPVTNNNVSDITLQIDKSHNYKGYDADAKFDANPIVGEKIADAAVTGNKVNGVEYVDEVTPGTVEELRQAIADALAGQSEVINIDQNFDVDGNWQAFDLGGYNGVASITIKGNNHTISNLNQPLLTGTFAGGGVVTIENLTIESANIVGESYNNLGLGAFLAYSDSSGGVVLNNCHLKNSTVTCTGPSDPTADVANAYAGGLVGYVSSPLTVTNCSVTGTTINGQKSAGAIVGHGGANVTVNGCEVSGCTISETLEGRDSAGAAAIAGRMSGGCTLTLTGTITVKNNTINQGAAAPAAGNIYTALGTPVTTGATLVTE